MQKKQCRVVLTQRQLYKVNHIRFFCTQKITENAIIFWYPLNVVSIELLSEKINTSKSLFNSKLQQRTILKFLHIKYFHFLSYLVMVMLFTHFAHSKFQCTRKKVKKFSLDPVILKLLLINYFIQWLISVSHYFFIIFCYQLVCPLPNFQCQFSWSSEIFYKGIPDLIPRFYIMLLSSFNFVPTTFFLVITSQYFLTSLSIFLSGILAILNSKQNSDNIFHSSLGTSISIYQERFEQSPYN